MDERTGAASCPKGMLLPPVDVQQGVSRALSTATLSQFAKAAGLSMEAVSKVAAGLPVRAGSVAACRVAIGGSGAAAPTAEVRRADPRSEIEILTEVRADLATVKCLVTQLVAACAGWKSDDAAIAAGKGVAS